jgi:hypothetical protein
MNYCTVCGRPIGLPEHRQACEKPRARITNSEIVPVKDDVIDAYLPPAQPDNGGSDGK